MLQILCNSVASANICSAMEAETISKNAVSPKNHKSRRNFLMILAVFVLFISSCYGQISSSNNNDGVSINGITWAKQNAGAFSIEDNGKLYTWKEAMLACPKGWRLPTRDELKTLINEGSVWKKKGSLFGNPVMPENYIFLPAANYNYDVCWGYYWSSTQRDEYNAYVLGFHKNTVGMYYCHYRDKVSVRCVEASEEEITATLEREKLELDHEKNRTQEQERTEQGIVSFSFFAQNYMVQAMNKWLQKGEFEKTANWELRISDNNRKAKASELLKEAERMYIYIAEYNNNLPVGNTSIGEYDADNERFLIRHSIYGDFFVPVPINEAAKFKENWKRLIKPKYEIVNDQIAIVGFIIEPIDIAVVNNNVTEQKENQNQSKPNATQTEVTVANDNVVEQKEVFNKQQPAQTSPTSEINYDTKLKNDFERIGNNDKEMLEFFRINKFSNYYYDFQSACSKRGAGKALLGLGLGTAGFGITFLSIGIATDENGMWIAGSVLIGTGGVLTIVSIPVSASAGARKEAIKNDFARRMFGANNYSYQPKLDFGFTTKGIGITLNF